MIDNTSAYIDCCKKAGLPINKVPKKGEEIELSYLMALKQYNRTYFKTLPHPIQMIYQQM